jgi:hypothetical protein
VTKLTKALSSTQYVANPYTLTSFGIGNVPFTPGTMPINVNLNNVGFYSRIVLAPTTYYEELFQSKYFYKFDPTCSTVINRMAELASDKVRNKRGFCSDEEFNFFEGIAPRLTNLIQAISMDYLISGMAIPDYATTRVMGNKLHPSLGRKRYTIPDKLWVRNTENIILKRVPFGPERSVYLKIPPEESAFILNGGKYNDGTENVELYNQLVRDFPEYVAAIRAGKNQILLPKSRPILRKPQASCDFPQPFLVPALAALKHKMRIKEMDHSLASKALEAIMHIKAGSDEFPVTEDDDTLALLRDQMQARTYNAADQLMYKLYTDHTVEINFVIPPLDALLSSAKYEAADMDIFMAMGFSRMLLVGESAKSNSGAGPQIILGPLAMLEEIRVKILEWVKDLYDELAEVNNLTNVPEPFFDSLVASDTSMLLSSAAGAFKSGVISKDLYAQLFGSDFETEHRQIEREVETIAASPMLNQMVQLGVQPHTAPITAPQDSVNPDGSVTKNEPQLPSDTINLGG